MNNKRGPWFETLEGKCREFQKVQDYQLIPGEYLIFHIDGRAFSGYTKRNFKNKPFDPDFIKAMDETTAYLCHEVGNVKVAFTQSDEITLICHEKNYETGFRVDRWFSDRVWKLCSIAASLATAKFNQVSGRSEIAIFDCKVWSVPTFSDAYAWISYRSIDCIRNSKQQFCQTYINHKKLFNLNVDEQVELCKKETGKDWESISDGLKFGRLFWKETQKLVKPAGECIRTSWTVHSGFPLIGQEGIDKFKQLNILQ